MAFNFDEDTDWLFMFCKKCWDYKKFLFDNPVDFEHETKDQYGKCTRCGKQQKVSIKEAREYYDHLNDHNQ